MNRLQQFFYLTGIILACVPFRGLALTSIDLQLQRLSSQGWSIEGVQFSLASIDDPIQQFKLSVRRLNLPEPFQQLSLLNIACPAVRIEADRLICQYGHAQLQANQADLFSVFFSLTLTRETVSLLIAPPADLSASQLRLDLSLQDSQWQLDFKAGNLILSNMRTLGVADLAQLEGELDLQGRLTGMLDRITDLDLRVKARQLTAATADARFASEHLAVTADVEAVRSTSGDWSVMSKIQLQQGLLYVEPFYLEVKGEPLKLATGLHWSPGARQLEIFHLDLQHPGTGRLQGNARFNTDGDVLIQSLQAYLVSSDLKQLFATYVKPFIEATPWAETQVSGQASLQLQIDNDQFSRVSSQFEELYLDDPQERFEFVGGQGYIDWLRHPLMRSSRLLWQSARLFSLPLGAVDVQVTHDLDSLTVAENTEIPILDGRFLINQFSVDDLQKEYARLRFKGELMPVSLQKLSAILDWPPLTGRLSGSIPGVSYHKGELKIEGQLRASVFDGEVVIDGLKIAGLLGALPRLTAHCQLSHLNLTQLTRKFGFGAMSGVLEGYVRDLSLENWRPVSFDAWLGTPEDDDSKHRISQKAVENITSLGGGGTSDVISRSVLRFFDSFTYDRLGVGCKLRRGVCEMRGVGAGRGGYYMIKGRGLPRIDIIGYNQRIDWQELLQRLERINASEDAVVE